MSASPFRAAYGRGFLHTMGLLAFVLAATFLGIGSLCRDAGLPLGWAMLATAFIWAGPAHVILVAGLMAKAPALSIALSVTLSSVRMLPMVASLMPYLRKLPQKGWQMLLAAHLTAISGWFEGMRLLPDMDPRDRMPFYLGLCSGLMGSALLATAAGYWLSAVISVPFRAGLLFLTPMFFLLSLFRNWRLRLDGLAIGFGFFGLLLAAPFAGASDLFFAGVGGGTLAYFAGQVMDKRNE